MSSSTAKVPVRHGPTITKIAAEDMSAAAGLAVKLGTGGTVTISDVATDDICGICVEAASTATDAQITIAAPGSMVKARAGTAINEGEYLTSESGGRLIDTTTKGNIVCGYALSDAADGDWFWIMVMRFTYGTYT